VITGKVRPGREPVVLVTVKGTQGRSADVEAILDTGFTESLSLPETLVLSLGLPFINTDYAILADGSVVAVGLYGATVVWGGQDRNIVVHCMEGDPLLGMALIYDHRMAMDAVDHGPVTLVPLP
jgi:clan AA aspartic protease